VPGRGAGEVRTVSTLDDQREDLWKGKVERRRAIGDVREPNVL
jgi:hypothetical protein